MKKIYSIVLMATALLISTNVWAVNVANWTQLQAAIATPNAEITLTANITLPTTGGTWDFNGAVIDCKYETVSATTSNDTVIYSYLNASKAKTYELQNVTLKNYGGTLGAIYVKAAATVNLGNNVTISTADGKYGVYLYTAGATLNNEGHIAAVYARSTATLSNAGSITGGAYAFYAKAAAVISNDGTMTGTTAAIYANNAAEISNNGTMTGAAYTIYATANAALTVDNNNNQEWSIYPTAVNAKDHTIVNNNGTLYFYGYGSKATKNFTGSVSIENAASAVTELRNTTFACALNLQNVTIENGTFKGVLSGSDITIHGGTFAVAPADGIDGYIEPQNALPKFEAGVGDLTIAPGYVWRSIDKYVVPEPGVVEVTHVNGSTVTCLVEEAFANAQDGDKITLIEDVTSYSPLWLGTAEANGAFRSVTLDLNGHTLSSNQVVSNTFELTRGALYITNSVPGQGGINHLRSNATGKASNIVFVTGSPTRMKKGDAYINPRNADIADLFTYLLVDEGVTMSAAGYGVSGICLYENAKGNHPAQLNYRDGLYSAANTQWGLAGGVRIDIKGTVDVTKYASKVNGLIRHPNEVIDEAPGTTDVVEADTANGAFFHIYPTAVMHTTDASEAIAVYSSGFARWQIEGLCQGATGVYVKSGVVDLTNAVIESTYTGPASITTGKSSGVESVGYAVVVESNNHYTGQQAIVIGGDTKISTEAAGGAAVVDVVDDTHESKVESIVINGGSFTGDNAIVISSETASENTTTVNGVTVTGEISVGGSTDPADVAAIMGADTHTTVIENPDGTTTVVVSAGAAPTAATEWVDVAKLPAGSDANWTGFTPGVIGNGTDAVTVSLGELQIISGNAIGGTQELTIRDKATLKVNKLIMNDFARIIVEAGGKLIVEGEQGINAPVVDNILLKASEDKQAIFLFNPAVTSNRHPNAKVEYRSNSFFSDHNVQQFFGIPTYNGGVTNIETTSAAAIYFDIWRNPGWDYVGAINVPVTPADPSVLDHLDKFNLPFALCCITSKNDIDNKPVFTFSGELTGNIDHTFVLQKGWTSMANAYMGPIDKNAIIAQLAEWNANYGTEQSVYTYDLNAATGAIQWHARNKYSLPNGRINAMQPMMFHNGSKVDGIVLDYSTLVWDPFVNASLAPARRQATNNITMAQINIVGENEVDYITVVADSELESDRSFCAPKYDNAGLQLYVTGDEKYDMFAADVIENSYIGYRTVNAGMYTISFENVRGEDLVLVDLVNGNRTNITEGAIYTFRAEANESNDYRFQIVTPAKTPTGIDNIEAGANSKKAGVYTLTGQYLGNASIFNTLPAGVYVVDGVKKVK